MPVISVRIPQLGEGLQEALLVEFLKSPGDSVSRDEPIYVMETDKATTDVESPYEGTLVEWLVETGTVLEIGTEIARMEVAEGVREMAVGHGTPSRSGAGTRLSVEAGTDAEDSAEGRSSIRIPPRTRRYLREHNLLDQVEKIPFTGNKMMPSDVDRYLMTAGVKSIENERFEVRPLPKPQVALNYRLSRGAQTSVPVTILTEIDWSAVHAARESSRAEKGPSGFAIACWCVVQAMKEHERFRSSLTTDGRSLQVFHHVNLGIAVARPNDEMLTAVVDGADQLSADEFFKKYVEQIRAAREGQDQADASTTLSMSNIGKAGMRMGIPAIVAPAVATIAIGEVYQQPVPDGDGFRFRPTVTATMTFDHRVVNGVGAADFLNEIKRRIESYN